MKYKLIFSSFAPSFEVEVNEHLNKGWKLYGNPFTTGIMFCQAMTKEETRDELDFPG